MYTYIIHILMPLYFVFEAYTSFRVGQTRMHCQSACNKALIAFPRAQLTVSSRDQNKVPSGRSHFVGLAFKSLRKDNIPIKNGISRLGLHVHALFPNEFLSSNIRKANLWTATSIKSETNYTLRCVRRPSTVAQLFLPIFHACKRNMVYICTANQYLIFAI